MGLLAQTSPWTDKICCGLWGGNERRAVLLFSIFCSIVMNIKDVSVFHSRSPTIAGCCRKSTTSSPITAQPASVLAAPGGLHRLQFSDLLAWFTSQDWAGPAFFFFFLRLFCPYYFGAVAWIPIHIIPWPLADIAGILVSCLPLPCLLREASLTNTVPTDPLASILQPTHQTHWPIRHQLSLWPLPPQVAILWS